MFGFLKRLRRKDRSPGSQVPADATSNGSAPYYVRHDDGSRVDVMKAARAAGWENLPESSATTLDDSEVALTREHERQSRDALEQARGELRDLTDAFDRLERALPHPRDIEALVEAADAAIERERSNAQELITLRREQTLRQRNLNLFKRENGLTEAAGYPVSRRLHLAMLGPLVLVESVANSSFFVQGSERGWIGGGVTALIISVINVGLGCAAGYFALRWRRHIEPRMRRIATAGVAAYVIVAIVFNLGVARLRDLAVTPGASERIDLQHLLSLSGPMSAASLALLIVGLLSSAFACWKGYRTDDPTPGHGERDRRYRDADESLCRGRDHQRSLVIGHAESVPERCQAILRKTGDDLEQMGDIVVRAERCAEGYHAKLQRIERWNVLWLKKYRLENIRVRTTPPPGYFADYPTFPPELDTTPLTRLAERLAFNERRFEELKAAAHRIALGQPQRVREAHRAFETHWSEVLRRADARHASDLGGLEARHE